MDIDKILEGDTFKNIEPERLEAVKNLAKEAEGKSMQEVMMLMIKYNKILSNGRQISKEERDVMLNTLFNNLDESKKGQFKSILKVLEMMN